MPTEPTEAVEFLTRAEVEHRLRVSTSTVRRLIEGGDLSVFKIGGQLRFDAADVDRYIAASRVAS